MINYIEWLQMPKNIGVIIIAMFLFMQIIGELLEFKGKVVPEFIKVRKYFMRKKQERKILSEMPERFANLQVSIDNVNDYYSEERVKNREGWIRDINEKLERDRERIENLEKKLDRNNEDTLSLLIDGKRSQIINFATIVSDGKTYTTREQFQRMFKLYAEYEKLIEENGLTNGEIDISYQIIKEAYETHMKNHTFLEDIKGYKRNGL